MRMIDADAAIAYLENHKKVAKENGFIWVADEDTIIKFLKEKCPTLTPPTEWVSVKDRLPEECADILLCRKILKIPEIGTYRQARFWVYDEIGDVYQVDDITHWMPIPTPYDIDHIHISEPPEG